MIDLIRRAFQTFVTVTALGLPGAAQAHPHIFIETGLVPVLDEKGQLTGVKVTWRYDELYSMLVLQNLGMDNDFDGKLTEDELKRLDGFDLNWVAGFDGDLTVHQGEAPLKLGKPDGRGVEFKDGKITTSHFRTVTGAESAKPWLLQAFDPTYYTAYDLTLGIETPKGCDVRIIKADLEKANTLVEEALYATPADPEGNFPEVGAAFADKVILRCAAGS